MTTGIRLIVEDIGHAWNDLTVLDGISLTAEPGEVMAIVVSPSPPTSRTIRVLRM